jgi:ATP-dependent DNA helicase RecG
LGDGLGDGLGDSPQSRLLQLIRAKPMISIAEMSQHLNISTTAVEKTIKRLKAKGALQRIGSARSGHWRVLENSK